MPEPETHLPSYNAPSCALSTSVLTGTVYRVPVSVFSIQGRDAPSAVDVGRVPLPCRRAWTSSGSGLTRVSYWLKVKRISTYRSSETSLHVLHGISPPQPKVIMAFPSFGAFRVNEHRTGYNLTGLRSLRKSPKCTSLSLVTEASSFGLTWLAG